VFWDPANDPMYTNFVSDALPGDLWYPWQYDPAIWPIAKGATPPTPSAVAEFFGDTMLANGVVYPFHNVGVGKHRFRLLNACNARFLDLSFVQERIHPKNVLTGEPVLTNTGLPVAANVDVWQIGTEGGFLPEPVKLVNAGVPTQPFILGPAERADIIVDFKTAGNVILYNVAGSPFPGGAPIFDWFAGSTKTPAMPKPGFGPNTRTIMRFVVAGSSPNTGLTVPVSIQHRPAPDADREPGGHDAQSLWRGWAILRAYADGARQVQHAPNLEGVQPHRRRPPDALPPLQRADPRPPGD
jgi:spore coat protein A